MNILETLGYGGIVALIGILIVFLGLVILIVAITIMGKIFKASAKRKEKAAAAAAAVPAPAAAPAPAPVVEQPAVEEAPAADDAQLIAVIAAALAAFDGGNKRLVVRKVRRVSGWNEAARSENLYHL